MRTLLEKPIQLGAILVLTAILAEFSTLHLLSGPEHL